jgi:hypothetical protein
MPTGLSYIITRPGIYNHNNYETKRNDAEDSGYKFPTTVKSSTESSQTAEGIKPQLRNMRHDEH